MAENNLIHRDLLKTHQKFLVEKTERVVTAVYLVTSLIIDKEPLKWRIRDVSLETLSHAHLGSTSRVVEDVEDLKSLISLANRSALVSPMNSEMLQRGLQHLANIVSGKAIFDEKYMISGNEEIVPEQPQQIKDKKVPQEISYEKKVVLKEQENNFKKTFNRKDKRRDRIIEALRRKRESSIKDIARAVKGCSEKTIQRELNTLIAEGKVNKKGERRWSVYSVA